ncbi:MAG: VWA domain-containing protein [Chloroflexia bacterium]|nr:VWA domain-containing protein [Chloroflexia bacterium]
MRRPYLSLSLPCRLLLAVLVSTLVLPLAAPQSAPAQVIVVEPPRCDPVCPEPVFLGDQLEIRSHRVDVAIRDGVAETRVDQVFFNPNDWIGEGVYLFPVPEGAAVAEFAMWVDGEPVAAELLDAEEARRTYEEIVRSLRDPALLEYVNRGLIRASVFPIPPGDERRIELAYGEVLPTEGGLTHYRYGLDTDAFSTQPLESASIRVEIEAAQPLRAVYSPSHDVSVDRSGKRSAIVGWEAADVRPDADFDLYYSASPDPLGAHLVSAFDPTTGEGHVMLLAAPGIDPAAETIAKDVVLVLDTSGSMEGEKIVQARTALTSVLEQLAPGDRFAVVEFSTGVRLFERGLSPAAAADEAIAWVKRLEAVGGTDINRALLEALASVEPERPTMLIFLTDGLPTEGETDIPDIMENVADNAPDNVRLFAFGVGDDVDTLLLDGLAETHHGRSFYVRPGQPLDETVSAFYGSISAPVLTDPEIDWGSVSVDDISPDPLPDLFAGAQLVALGRYDEPSETTIELTGEVNGEIRTFTFPNQRLSALPGNEWLPRLWATRRIGHLLNQIRLHGENPELVDAVVDLSVRYGIVTPYTSYLLTEEDILSSAGRNRVLEQAREAAAAPAPSSGFDAVERAQAAGNMAIADSSSGLPTAVAMGDGSVVETGDLLRLAGGNAFLLSDGIWTDTRFDADTMVPERVAFLSDDYFALLERTPELAAAFALGDRVIAVAAGVAYEVTPARR